MQEERAEKKFLRKKGIVKNLSQADERKNSKE